MSNYLKCSIALSAVFVLAVPLVNEISNLFDTSTTKDASTAGYPVKQMIAGMISETTRAFITCYLYSITENKGSSLGHGIKLGLLYSALIASLYIILGGWYFRPLNPTQFVITDSTILAVQGLLSGFVLFHFHKQTT